MSTITQQISQLPDYPSRANPSSFNEKAEAWMAAERAMTTQLNTFATQANALRASVNADKAATALSASQADAARVSAESATAVAVSSAGASKYNAATVYTFGQSVIGSDGIAYRFIGNVGVVGDNPVGSVTGNWTANITGLIDDAVSALSKLWSSSKVLDELRAMRLFVEETANAIEMDKIRAMFSSGELGGYWEPTLSSYYEDSAGTVPASLNGVVGAWANQISGQPAAIQATTANKPYLRKTPQTNRYWLDGNTATANLTATFPSSLGSSCTIARLDPELGVQWSESQTIGTTYNLITPYAYHGPMLTINRALTAQEKAIVARVMGRFMPQLGPELVTNGTFDTNLSGWAYTSGQWEWRAGAAHKVPGIAGNFTTTALPASSPVFVKAGFANVLGGKYRLFVSTTYASPYLANNTVIRTSVTTATNVNLTIRGDEAASDFDVDNVSARRIL